MHYPVYKRVWNIKNHKTWFVNSLPIDITKYVGETQKTNQPKNKRSQKKQKKKRAYTREDRCFLIDLSF